MNLSPFPSRRAPVYANIPDVQWNDWRWQLKNRLNTTEDFESVFTLTESEKKALSTQGLFRVDITPYFASLINPDDPNDPIRRQVIPTADEITPFIGMMEDSLAEDRHSPVPGLVHRYPDRVLMLVTTQCASYCRYCTRSRIVGDPTSTFSRAEFEMQIDYLKRTPQVRDVLLSGGDPLVLSPKLLDELLGRLREIPHIEIIRIGSRVPVFMPQRVTDDFCETLQKYHPLWLNIHVNHPNEISLELDQACDRLSELVFHLATNRCFWQGSMTAYTFNANWCRTWCGYVCALITSTSVTWWMVRVISAHRLLRVLKSSKGCADTRPVIPYRPMWSMLLAGAGKYRLCPIT